MIKKEDIEFHTGFTDDVQACETNFFPFAVPSERISGNFYCVTRPSLGICMSDMTIQDRIAPLVQRQLYVDNQQHMPIPKSLANYTLPSGLSVNAVDPFKRYELRYEGYADTLIELEWNSLMEPYDCNDPEMDPLAAPRIGESWDKSWSSGHCEFTGHVHGTARIRGKNYKVDYIGTADRSWGVRRERNLGNLLWTHGAFSKNLAFHAMTDMDVANEKGYGKPLSGYILEDGEVIPLVDIKGIHSTYGVLIMGAELNLTDVNGRVFTVTGHALNAAPWAPSPGGMYSQSLMQWNYKGEIGYGYLQHGFGNGYILDNREKIFC